MGRNNVKAIVGWIIILGHMLIIAYIFVGRPEYLDMSTRTATALTVAPVTAVYFTNVVKSFLGSATQTDPGDRVNWSYTAISVLIPTSLMVSIVYIISIYPREQFTTPQQLQATLSGLEVCLGGTVGLVVDSLFPKRGAA